LRDHEGLLPATDPADLLERPSRMRNDINRLATELHDLDPHLVERLYQNVLLLLGRRPGLPEVRAYIAELRVTMDERMLRGLVCLPPVEPPTTAADARRPAAPIVVVGTRVPGGRATRGPGRPSWTRELFWARYRDACARTEPPHTYRSVAPQFLTLDGHRGADPEYLRKLVRRYGLPPELEQDGGQAD
jgi:hypothetical protein